MLWCRFDVGYTFARKRLRARLARGFRNDFCRVHYIRLERDELVLLDACFQPGKFENDDEVSEIWPIVTCLAGDVFTT